MAPGRLTGLGQAALRYAVAAGGAVGTAGAHFLLSFVLLHALRPAAFGAFSFLFILAQFSWGIWSALFCAPLPALLQQEGDKAGGPVDAIVATNVGAAAIAFLPFLGAALLLELSMGAAMLFALFGTAALLRWFARSYSYAVGTPWIALASDGIYCGVLLIAIGWMALGRATDARIVYGALAAGSLLGLAPFGTAFLKRLLSATKARIRRYMSVWRQYSRWSLMGVLTTEVTGNAHAYFVTGAFGPAAFSIVAATSLLSRPVGVVMNGLTEFERARLAHLVAREPIDDALTATRRFRTVLVGSWLANTAVAVLILVWFPRLVFPEAYSPAEIWLGTSLWFLVAAARVLRTPESVFLQAAGEFQPLAKASVASAAVSLISVVVLGSLAGVLWSVAGILIGEVVYAVSIWRAFGHWKRCRGAGGGLVSSSEQVRTRRPR